MRLRNRVIQAVLLVCLLALAASGVHAWRASTPLGISDYWALVDESRQELIVLSQHPGEDAHSQLEKMAARWEAVSEVRLEDGSVVEVDGSYWASLLRADPPNLNNLLAALGALQAAHLQGTLAPGGDSASLREILARPEFQWQQSESNWLTDAINQFLKWLSDMLGGPHTINLPGNSTALVLGIVAGLVVLVILFFTLRGLFADLARDALLAQEDDALDASINAQTALARAEELSGQGDFRSAVRYLYISSLLILDERGLLVYDRTRTNREYLKDLALKPQVGTLLRNVIDVFDRVWYGFQPLDATTYQHYVEQVNQLKEQK